MPPIRRVAIVILLAGLAALARAADAPEHIIQEQVELLRSGGMVQIGDATIASAVVLPAFYEHRGFQPAWTDATADDLLHAIGDSARHGLDPANYHLAALERLRAAAPGPAQRAERDLLQTDALIRLAYHLLFGKVDPERLDANWNFTRDLANLEPEATLQQALVEGHVSDWLTGLAPHHPFYRSLIDALAEHRRLEAAGGWPAVPEGPTLKPGMTDPRVPALRRRLVVTRDLATDDASPLYDATLAAAVRTFQERHGLTPDGVAGAATVQEMNLPVGHRIDQLRATLERCRWVMRDLPGRFVLVNVAGFQVYYMKDGAPVWESPVVVGTTFNRTPIFRANMTYVVLNPTWTVPPGMLRNEILPAMRRDPKYLERKGLQMVDGRVVQPPGPGNALGRIKLMFPNPHAVYLHDTPSRAAFRETSRTFSHGCVRVEKPFELAALVLDDPQWTLPALHAAVDTGKTRTLLLAQPLPVLILYWTAAVGRDGRTYFLPDVYGRDPAIVRGLAGPFVFWKRPGSGAVTSPVDAP